MKLRFLLLFNLVSFYINSQVIPEAQRVNWGSSGLNESFAEPDLVADAQNFGAKGDGITNDYASVQNAVNSFNGQRGVVYFAEGTYLIKSTLSIPSNVVLRGESSELSVLKFNLSSSGYDCIKIGNNQSTSFNPLISGFTKGSSTIQVENPGLQVGDYAEIRQKNGSWDIDPKSYATYCVGQIVKVAGVSGNNVTIEEALRIDYSASLVPEIRKITPVKNVGIEYLKIERENDATPGSGGGYNIFFLYAANCWVKSVESSKSVGAHILADASTHLQISGTYIHDAFTYEGTATRGYGVTLTQHTGDCLVEDNIFKHLRHAMMVKQGANGNVFGYNYSIEPTRAEQFGDLGGDISLHGHYAFANLFEGNIVQNIHIDQTGGPSGPYNTFFRNRAGLYGIWMTAGAVQSDKQNFVGNEVILPKSCSFTYNGFCYIYKGNYETAGSGHFEYGNNLKSAGTHPIGTSQLSDKSYYLNKGIYLSINQTTVIGLPSSMGTGTNDAEERYISGETKTYPDPLNTLPVSLEDFHAELKDGYAEITWKTSNEISNDFFLVEKSLNSKDFYPLKRVEGSGNSKDDRYYTAVDNNIKFPRIYYRLRQTDYNGATICSDIITLINSETVVDLTINPNPVEDYLLKFEFDGAVKGEKLTITIFDSSGKEKIKEEIIAEKSGSSYFLNLKNHLSQGIYFLDVKSIAGRFQKRFILR